MEVPMIRKLRPFFSYSNVTATMAVFIALGGGAYATSHVSSNSGTPSAKKKKPRPRTRVRRGPKGPKGAKGEKGPKGDTGPATGPAGGGLVGNYPNPGIAPGAVGPSQLGVIPAVRAQNTADEIIPDDGAEHVVTFNGELYDTQGLHSTTTNTSLLTAPVSGVYTVSAYVLWASNSTGRRNLNIKTSSAIATVASTVAGAPGGSTGQNATTQLRLTAGESVSAHVRQQSGGDLNVSGSSEGSPSFQMTWVAP
jgi:hypothetical protein